MSLSNRLKAQEEAANALMQGNPNTEQSDQENANTEVDGTLPKVEPKAEPQADPKNVDWEHKYNVLNGMYKTDTQNLKSQLQQAQALPQADTALVTNLQAQLAQLQDRNSQLEQAVQSAPVASQTELDNYLVEEYGEEFAKAVAQTAAAQSAPLLKKLEHLESQFSTQSESIAQNESDRAMNALKSTLSNAGLNFEQVNNDALFHKWLSETDHYSGMQRQQLLEQAFNSGDTQRTARFYTDFAETQNRTAKNNPFHDHVDRLPNQSVGEQVDAQRPTFNPNAMTELGIAFRRGQITRQEYEDAERKLFAQLKG